MDFNCYVSLAVDGSASTMWDNRHFQVGLNLTIESGTDADIEAVAPRLLRQLIPDLRIIAIMRDPVSR